jgi:flavin reductase (DIM6/NTAB) family NADH-FMN oxidoreductase RutF
MSGSVSALFQRLTAGVYVIGVAHAQTRNAFTAAWVMQVSYEPLLLALSINPNHSSYLLLKEGREPMCYRETGQLDGSSTLYPDVLGDL